MTLPDLQGFRAPRRRSALAATLCLALFLAAGCVSDTPLDPPAFSPAELAAPVPSFLVDSVAVLLANDAGYRAHIEVENPQAGPVEAKLSGELSVRQRKLFFARQPANPKDTTESTGVAYIWDPDSSSGFLLSEALQGYAPVRSEGRFTNCVETALMKFETIGDYRCQAYEATVFPASGAPATYELWRAQKPKGLPVQIRGLSNAPPVRLLLSRIHAVPDPPATFQPPAAFRRYSDAGTLVNEFMRRKLNLAFPGR